MRKNTIITDYKKALNVVTQKLIEGSDSTGFNLHQISKDIKEENLKEERNQVEKSFIKLDNLIAKEVDSKIWECHDIRTRKIRINSDLVCLKRRYYINKKTGERMFHLDNILGLKNGQLLDDATFIDNLKIFIEDRSYKNFGLNFNNIINGPTFSKMLKKINLSFKMKVVSKKENTVFIAVDGMNLKEWGDKGKHEYRTATLWTKSLWTSKGKYELFNRIVVPLGKKDVSGESMVKYLIHVIKKSYPNAETINLVGDGEAWISNLAKNLVESRAFKKVDRFIDKYHFKEFVKALIGKKNLEENWHKVYKMKTKDELKKFLSPYMSNNITSLEYASYQKILRWFNSFRAGCLTPGLICPIEGIQSNLIANYFRRKRIFSKGTLWKILNSWMAILNNWKVIKIKDDEIPIYDQMLKTK